MHAVLLVVQKGSNFHILLFKFQSLPLSVEHLWTESGKDVTVSSTSSSASGPVLDLFEQWEDMDFTRIRNETESHLDELFKLQTCPKPLHAFEHEKDDGTIGFMWQRYEEQIVLYWKTLLKVGGPKSLH